MSDEYLVDTRQQDDPQPDEAAVGVRRFVSRDALDAANTMLRQQNESLRDALRERDEWRDRYERRLWLDKSQQQYDELRMEAQRAVDAYELAGQRLDHTITTPIADTLGDLFVALVRLRGYLERTST